MKKAAKKRKLRIEIVTQMLSLATAGFGLVAALAWNNLIQEIVNAYIKQYFPANSGVISLAIYAIVITVIAVFVIYQLSRILDKFKE